MKSSQVRAYVRTVTPTCAAMQSLCQPLNRLGIDYLSYTRIYNNGERFFFSTLPTIIEDYFDNKRYKKVCNEVKPDNFPTQKIVLWSTLPHQDVFQNAKQMGINNGIYIFNQKKDDYYDSFGFATSKLNESVVNGYLSNLDLLKDIAAGFQKEAESIIQIGEQQKFQLPFNSIKLEPFLLTEYSDQVSSIKLPLSARQRDCVKLLLQGLTAKEIAIKLNLSYRTIETYLETLKKKLGCKNKAELLIMLSTSR